MCRYFALIIRAISVLEGIALVGNPNFAIIDEAYPYIAQRLLTDDTPRLRESLHYMVYGKSNVFDADRLIDLLNAFETFTVSTRSATGNLVDTPMALPVPAPPPLPSTGNLSSGTAIAPPGALVPAFFPEPKQFMDFVAAATGAPVQVPGTSYVTKAASEKAPGSWQTLGEGTGGNASRAALLFLLSDSGTFFRAFLMDEIVRSIDALSRSQLAQLVERLGLQGVVVPVFLPLSNRTNVPLAPEVSKEDERQVESVAKLVDFLAGGSARRLLTGQGSELLPLVPQVARQILPEVVMRLTSRVAARFIRTFYL
jgi:aarF domain-containing kinase